MARFLDALSPVLHPGSGPLEDRPDGLTLTTVDAARGREWRVVFVIDAGDHVIPGAVGPSDPERWEGQQRIFYMLSTRASGLLYFCCPRQEGRGFDARHSRFLDLASE